MTTITKEVQLVTIACGECGGVYAILEKYRSTKHANGGGWTCPYCKCSWGFFGKTPAEKAQEELTRERARHDQTRADRDHAEACRRAEKAAKTKLKKRIAAGVCPCCKRTFQDLARHMAGQHPEFSDADA